ncbi:MAG TPA: hypothetical protein VN597_19940 [Streptosporangiaceae bacterium]|nr:hypothetical protein [Streptosporangiaceae bacterium]
MPVGIALPQLGRLGLEGQFGEQRAGGFRRIFRAGHELGPDDPAAVVAVGAAPGAQPGQHIEPVLGVLVPGRTGDERLAVRAGVRDRDPDGRPHPGHLGREVAVLAAGGVLDRVGGQFGGAAHDVVPAGMISEQHADQHADLGDLVFLAGEDPAPSHGVPRMVRGYRTRAGRVPGPAWRGLPERVILSGYQA